MWVARPHDQCDHSNLMLIGLTCLEQRQHSTAPAANKPFCQGLAMKPSPLNQSRFPMLAFALFPGLQCASVGRVSQHDHLRDVRRVDLSSPQIVALTRDHDVYPLTRHLSGLQIPMLRKGCWELGWCMLQHPTYWSCRRSPLWDSQDPTRLLHLDVLGVHC